MPDAPGPLATVTLPAALLRLFPSALPRVEVSAGSVADAIAALDRRWPGMRDRLCDSRPAIRRHIAIFVAGRRARLDTPIPAGAAVLVTTSMSGG